jgi:hypothetical protein
MQRLRPLLAVMLFAAGCGGDDDADADGATGATGAQGLAEGAYYDITVGEFIAELQPQKQEILEDFIADSKACRGVEVENSFVLLVSAASIDADQDAPLADLVEEQC